MAALAQQGLERATQRTLAARDAYTYLHVVIVAAILLAAVGNELVIAHPKDELPAAELAVLVSGPALYLLAQAALRLRLSGTLSPRRLVGALACLLAVPVGLVWPALVVGGLLLAVLVGVIVADQVVAWRRRHALA